MSQPVSGHNTLFEFEVDPTLSPGVFTVMPQVTSSIDMGGTKESTKTTPHASVVDVYVVSPVLERGEMTISGNYIYGNSAHAAFRDHYNDGLTFGIRIKGPGWVSGTNDTEIHSGECTAFKILGPVAAGIRAFEATFRPSGPYKIDDTTFS